MFIECSNLACKRSYLSGEGQVMTSRILVVLEAPSWVVPVAGASFRRAAGRVVAEGAPEDSCQGPG